MPQQNADCPCKRLHCSRHGNCSECRSYHQTAKNHPYPACDLPVNKKRTARNKNAMEQLPEKWIAQPLLQWYDSNARTLPWREEPKPYYVWISEIMLQQTRVEAVKPYFQRFLQQAPDIPSLAALPDEQLMKLWEGLGYYNRARNLKKAAQEIVERCHGVMPGAYEELLTLPGIGPYTAGAIASIAFGQPVPAVDGNVLRVFARLFTIPDDITRESTKKSVVEWLGRHIPSDRPGDFNQALMELGATVCIPHGEPKCRLCPLNPLCAANQTGTTAVYPVKSPRKARSVEEKTVFLLTWQNHIAINRRLKKGVLSGLWEFPNVEGSLAQAETAAYLHSLGLPIATLQKGAAYKHVFTHIEWHMLSYRACLTELPQASPWQWVTIRELESIYPLPSAFQPLFQSVKQEMEGETP